MNVLVVSLIVTMSFGFAKIVPSAPPRPPVSKNCENLKFPPGIDKNDPNLRSIGCDWQAFVDTGVERQDLAVEYVQLSDAQRQALWENTNPGDSSKNPGDSSKNPGDSSKNPGDSSKNPGNSSKSRTDK